MILAAYKIAHCLSMYVDTGSRYRSGYIFHCGNGTFTRAKTSSKNCSDIARINSAKRRFFDDPLLNDNGGCLTGGRPVPCLPLPQLLWPCRGRLPVHARPEYVAALSSPGRGRAYFGNGGVLCPAAEHPALA